MYREPYGHMTNLVLPVKSRDGVLVDKQSLDDLIIERRFGKTQYFISINSENGEFKLVRNENNHNGGTKHTPEVLKDAGADVVIAAHMGAPAYGGITQYGIEIYRGDLNVPLSKILEKYNLGTLEKFDPSLAQIHHDHH